MGFGILFIGYMFLLSIPLRSMGICAELLGYLLMLRALSMLRQYQKAFGQAYRACLLLLPFGVFSLVLLLFKWFGALALYERLYDATALVYSMLLSLSLLIFHYYLLNGIERQARDVELMDIVRQAMRNRIMTAVYFVLLIAVNFLDIPAVTEVVPFSSMISVVSLFGIVWILLNAKMIFNCYMWICLPGDEEMLPREGGILPNLFNIRKNKPVDEAAAAAAAAIEKQKQREAYDAEMRRREEARTKKNKRRKKH